MIPKIQTECYKNANFVFAHTNLCTEIHNYSVLCNCSLKITASFHWTSLLFCCFNDFFNRYNFSITLLFMWIWEALCLLPLDTDFIISTFWQLRIWGTCNILSRWASVLTSVALALRKETSRLTVRVFEFMHYWYFRTVINDLFGGESIDKIWPCLSLLTSNYKW